MTQTTVDSAMLKDVLRLFLKDNVGSQYGTGKDLCLKCVRLWKSHHKDCPVLYAQQLLKEIGDE